MNTTPNLKGSQHSIAINYKELALLLLAARNDFEYLAKQLEQGSGRDLVQELIEDYRSKARQADYFVDLIIEGGAP